MQSRFVGSVARFGMVVAMLATAQWLGTGCEHGSDAKSQREAFIGVWEVTKIESGSVGWYHFLEDGSFYKTRQSVDGPVHFAGTWTVTGGTLKGPFTNPGVGEGEIVATISNGVMSMDFIEYWHEPPKHVACTGKKLF
jgi:hypothetical protein